MLLLQLSPYSKPVAITEIVIILAGAALLGYILARLIMNSRIRNLKEETEQRKIELVECRALPDPVLAVKPVANKGALRTVYPVEEPNAGIRQDLKVIEGIGPKIEEILNKNGIINYSRLANMPPVRIAAILKGAGPRFQLHDPTTWPQQASLANEGKWEELEALKLKLISGRQVD